jgi:hypothetical protein
LIFDFFWDVSFLGYTLGYIGIQMDVRILRISPIGTDFLEPQCWVLGKKRKKSVPIGEIRKIRTSICIPMYPQV